MSMILQRVWANIMLTPWFVVWHRLLEQLVFKSLEGHLLSCSRALTRFKRGSQVDSKFHIYRRQVCAILEASKRNLKGGLP